MNFEYYAYGNSGFLFQVFNAIASLMGSDGYGGLMTTTALLAFIITLGITAFKLDFSVLSSWFIGLVVVWYGFMLPKTHVIIMDREGVQAPLVVANVPLGIAVPAHYASSVGDWLTRSSEAVFSLPDDLQYSRNGLLFGSRLYQALRSTSLDDSVLQTDWSSFMYNCAFYDMALYHFYSVRDLARSQDLLTTLGQTNQALFVAIHRGNRVAGNWGPFSYNYYQYTSGSTSMSCDEAYTNLKQRTLDEAGYLQLKLANNSYPLLGGTAGAATAVSKLTSGLEATYRTFFKATSSNALQAITQEAMINVVRSAEIQNARTSRDSEKLAIALAVAQAERQTLMAMKTSGSVAADYLPLLRNTLEGLLIALFPIIVVISVLALHAMWGTLLYYFMALIWIQLWPMLYAILNLAATANTESNVAAWLSQAGAPTLVNASPVLSQFAQTQAMAGNLIWAIPVIAGALVMGGKGLASAVMGKTAASAESSASSAGSQAGQGNVSMGNTSANNTSMNKQAMDSVYATAGPSRIQGATGSFSSQAGVAQSFRSADLPVSAGASASEGARFSELSAQSREAGHQEQEVARNSIAMANASAVGYIARQGTGSSSSQDISSKMDAQQRQSATRVIQAAEDLAKRTGITDTSSASSALALGLGMNVGGGTGPQEKAEDVSKMGKILNGLGLKAGPSGKIGVNGQQSTENRMAQDFTNAVSALKREGVTMDDGLAKSVASSSRFQQDAREGKEYTQSVTSNLTRSQSAERSAANHFATAERYQKQAERSASTDGSVRVDGSASVGQAFANSGQTLQQAQQQPLALAGDGQQVAGQLHQGIQEQTKGTTMDTEQGGFSSSHQPSKDLGGLYQQQAGAAAVGFGQQSQQIGQRAQGAIGNIQNQIDDTRNQVMGDKNTMMPEVQHNIASGQQSIQNNAKGVATKGQQQYEARSGMHFLGDQQNGGSGSQRAAKVFEDPDAFKGVTGEARQGEVSGTIKATPTRPEPKTPLQSPDYQPWRKK
ncbi:conjugal transfer protein TraG N-terminal domain-containing protein [Neisseriaceae bacterium TC5R-5]|nr:conjugal transfer protein TraG N-terminal domain-containing protein [Neisseriaceae bacterium TC5R-5]